MAHDDTTATDDWVTVLTTLPTLPLPPNSERAVLETERLIIRPLTEEDVAALHELRTLPHVMVNTKRGIVDDDLAMTRERLASFLTPHDANTFNCAICLRAAGDNKLIGIGGVHMFRNDIGWPELGYMFHSDHWGKGYATEFVRGFVQLYSALPRPAEPVPLRVERDSLPAALGVTIAPDGSSSPAIVEELLVAIVPDYNANSQKVLTKSGFAEFLLRVEDDVSKPGTEVLLHYYQYFPSRKAASTV